MHVHRETGAGGQGHTQVGSVLVASIAAALEWTGVWLFPLKKIMHNLYSKQEKIFPNHSSLLKEDN